VESSSRFGSIKQCRVLIGLNRRPRSGVF